MTTRPPPTEELMPFATPRQAEYLKEIIKLGSIRAAARELGVASTTVFNSMNLLRAKAAKRGIHPGLNPEEAPEGYHIKGKSTLVDGDGQVKMQWVKTQVDKDEALQTVIDAIGDAAQSLKSLPKIAQPKGKLSADLCTLYTITDFHMGMYASQALSGRDWNLDVAYECFMSAINRMIDGSPDADTAILNIQGDFMHWDGMEAKTPTAGHMLEAACTPADMVKMSLVVVCKAVELVAKKHKNVRVIAAEGNHDLYGSIWLREALSVMYDKTDRISIDVTQKPFYVHQHGKIMIGIHHGHKVKNKSLPGYFASDPEYRPIWGASDYTYIHTGHYHHTEQDMSEGGGAIVERHPTLAANDAYATVGGYVSWRAARAITYHVEDGEYMRVSISP